MESIENNFKLLEDNPIGESKRVRFGIADLLGAITSSAVIFACIEGPIKTLYNPEDLALSYYFPNPESSITGSFLPAILAYSYTKNLCGYLGRRLNRNS